MCYHYKQSDVRLGRSYSRTFGGTSMKYLYFFSSNIVELLVNLIFEADNISVFEKLIYETVTSL